MTGGGWRGHGNLRYATHFMVSFLRFLALEREMPGFPTNIVGTPTIRGKARRYEGSREEKDRLASGKEGSVIRHVPKRREISLYASRPLRRSEAGRKSRLAPFEMTVWD